MSHVLDTPEKTCALQFILRNAAAFAQVSDAIFYFAELGMQEHRSAALLAAVLEKDGFQIERGLSGFPTGFVAQWGSGKPVIALHTEYDANPGLSQRSGIAVRQEIVPGAPGHCEGHNVNAAVTVTAAMAIKAAMARCGLGGTLKIFGAPAEEVLISRPFYVRDGHFAEVDVAFRNHILDDFHTSYGTTQSAAISAEFTFSGVSAHAAIAPWKAQSALDAVVLMDAGMAQQREHMPPQQTAHRVITNGGMQPNIIPERASVWWFLRGPTADRARDLFERAQRIAQGAALMTGCRLNVEIRAAAWPVRGNEALAKIVQRNIEAIGAPQWTVEEQSFARALQRQAGVREAGLRPAAAPLTGPSRQSASSSDCGDISWVVPMAHIYFPGNIPEIGFHHWAAGAALTTSIAHKGGCAGAMALASSVLDLLATPDLVTAVKETFSQETGDVQYRSLLPQNLKPPVDLNRAEMEKFRPLMEQHYPREMPVFN